MTTLIVTTGLLAATLALLLLHPGPSRRGRLARLLETSPDAPDPDSPLRLAGLPLRPETFRLLSAALALAAAVLVWPFLPGIPAAAASLLALLLPGAWLRAKAGERGRAIDRSLPLALSRISAGLLAGASIPDTLQSAGDSLQLEGEQVLSPELHRTAADLRVRDRAQALDALAGRSPSVSLANLATLLEGYGEAGGSAYTGVLSDISARLQQILAARARARAKASEALLSARVLPLVLFGVLAALGRDPLVRSSLSAWPVQAVIALSMGAMAAGYALMRSLIAEAA